MSALENFSTARHESIWSDPAHEAAAQTALVPVESPDSNVVELSWA